MLDTPELQGFRLVLLTRPGEQPGVEYKSSMPVVPDHDFTLSLLRHFQGMANTGGGWLVIGFLQGDGGVLAIDPNHSMEIANSYEITKLSDMVNSHVQRRQQVRLSLFFEVHPGSGLPHPMIHVEGFDRTPFVCRGTKSASDSGRQILREGATYIRRANGSTSEVSTPEDWDELISRSIQNRREELLADLKELLDRLGSPAREPAKPLAEKMQLWLAESRGKVGWWK